MGVVFEARDPLIGRTVALKMIRLDSLGTPDERDWLQERLFREARSAGALSHPGIVVIYDLGTSEDLAYIAMEYVDGPTLEQILIKTPRLNGSEAVSVVRQTAEALDHAHGAGVVHRDIKPANIMLRAGSIVKVTDFGIAKITTTQQITRTGMTMGTPSYMSPEQIRAMDLDGRADQFSLAVVAYQILTGLKPFQGDSLATLVHQIVYEDRPSARSVNQALPEAVDDVLHRGLAKLPQDRYRNCVKFAEALAVAMRESPTIATAGSASVTPLEKQESDFTALFADFIEAKRLEVEKKERAAKLQRTVEEVERLLVLGDLRAAASVLDEAREQFADDPAFLKVSERVEHARREAERQQRVNEVVQRAQERLQTKHFAEALSILDNAGAECGNPAPVVELRARVLEEQATDKRDRERREYEADLGKTLAHAKELMALRSPADAVTFLESATGRYGKEGAFTKLFASAIEAKRLAEARAAKLKASVANAAESLAIGDWQPAQTILEDAKRDFPGEPALAPLLFRLEQMRQAALQESLAGSDARSAVSPAPEIAAARREVPTWAEPQPAVIKKRVAISKGLLVGASAAAVVVLALLLVKVFVSPAANNPIPQAGSVKPAGSFASPSLVDVAQPSSSTDATSSVSNKSKSAAAVAEEAKSVRTTDISPMSLSPSVLNLSAGGVGTVNAFWMSGGLKNYRISASTKSRKILVNMNETTGVLTVIGLVPTGDTPAIVNLHPRLRSRSDNSQDGVIEVNVAPIVSATPEKLKNSVPLVASGRAVEKAPVPSTPREGRIVWSGSLPPGSRLNIDGGTASVGTLTGALPGVPVTVEVHPDSLTLIATPNSGNAWTLMTIQNGSDTAQSLVVIKWKAQQ